MSGGSYDYLYCMVEGMADRIVQSGGTPERQRFAKHLRRVARAMHAIRWVDSCDLDRGEENEAIRAVFDPSENATRDTKIAGLMRALDELADRAAAAEAARPRWIQVTERTPTRSEIHGSSPDVLAQTDDGDIVVAFVFVLDGALIWSSGHTRHRVVAWQPLPERWTP